MQLSIKHIYNSILALSITIFGNTLLYAAPLPSPLSLQQAIAIAIQDHPTLKLINTQLDIVTAQAMEAAAYNNGTLFLELESKRIKQSTSDLFFDDGRVHIGARQVLFDFGVSSATRKQHQFQIGAQIQVQKQTQIQQMINTERAFYDVLLADLLYTANNEIMTVAFLRYDKIKERHSLNIFSDLELTEAEYRYRILLNKRKNSEILQRITRQKLASLLNKPNDIPLDLLMPELRNQSKSSPDAEEFYQRSLNLNPLILSLQKTINARNSAIQVERSRNFPEIAATLDYNEYQRDLVSRNKIEIAIQLRLPLYDSGLQNAKSKQAIAALQNAKAQLQLAKLQLQQTVLEAVLTLDSLHVQRTTHQIELDFREYNLDKRRAEYEMELQTNMGSAMANLTQAQWQAMKTNFDIELTWKKLDLLLGSNPYAKSEDINL